MAVEASMVIASSPLANLAPSTAFSRTKMVMG